MTVSNKVYNTVNPFSHLQNVNALQNRYQVSNQMVFIDNMN